jgi:hypothetical protein
MADLGFIDGAAWLNEPPAWRRDARGLHLETGARTDFWQGTLYGFRRDEGHFLGREITGDFAAAVTFEGAYEALYDQAGLMLRIGAETWIKAGIEHSDGVANFSAVVTRGGASDWSVVAVPGAAGPQTVRLIRKGGAAVVHYRGAEGGWHLMRVADFPEGPARLGPMACSPERAGFRVTFTAFEVGPAPERAIH